MYGWTDDGKGVLFTEKRDPLSAVDILTGAVTQIGGPTAGNSPVAVRATRPSTAIVFGGQTGRTSPIDHVEVRDATMGPGRIVARYGPDEGTFLNEPRWRPGSDEVLLFYAFGAGVQLRKELVIVAAVTGARRTQPTPVGIRGAAWSSDGRRIVYTTLFEARVREAEGSNGPRAVPSGATSRRRGRLRRRTRGIRASVGQRRRRLLRTDVAASRGRRRPGMRVTTVRPMPGSASA